MRRRTSSQDKTALSPAAMPRDVEAVEQVIAVLDQGVQDGTDAHQKITAELVDQLGLSYGAVWLPQPGGAFHRLGEYGPLAAAMAASPSARIASITAADGYGGQAIRSRATVLVDASDDPATCARWGSALAAGATHGCLLPLVENGSVTALYEYFNLGELPFTSARQGKWDSRPAAGPRPPGRAGPYRAAGDPRRPGRRDHRGHPAGCRPRPGLGAADGAGHRPGGVRLGLRLLLGPRRVRERAALPAGVRLGR
jgi:hypothetical protein